MKRRDFLGSTGVLLGATALPLSSRGDEPGQAQSPPRRVLLTSAEPELARSLAKSLDGQLIGMMVAPASMRTSDTVVVGLNHDEAILKLVSDVDAIIHALPVETRSAKQRIEYATRQTFNLLGAAAASGVKGMVLLSALDMVLAHDARFAVDEGWRPLPTLESGLAEYLAECTCREFAREGKLRVIVLRLGRLSGAAELQADELRFADAAEAVRRALAIVREPPKDFPPWSVFHINSAAAGSRALIDKARKVLGFRPGER